MVFRTFVRLYPSVATRSRTNNHLTPTNESNSSVAFPDLQNFFHGWFRTCYVINKIFRTIDSKMMRELQVRHRSQTVTEHKQTQLLKIHNAISFTAVRYLNVRVLLVTAVSAGYRRVQSNSGRHRTILAIS